MEGPGMSLFQGGGSIHINNSAQDRLEEQEELEDQKRRDAELKHKLENAFDDFLDEDEGSSVNSSGNFTLDAARINGGQKLTRPVPPTYMESLNHLKEQHSAESSKPYFETPKSQIPPHIRCQDDSVKTTYSPYGAGDGQNLFYHQEHRGHLNGMDNRQEYMNNEQLKFMHEIREKECQQLAAQLEQMEGEVDGLRARLAAALSEREKVELSLHEAHHLLASSKHKMMELEQQVAALTEKLAESDLEKERLKLELRAATASLQEVQQRLLTQQVAHTHDTDALFREHQDRHREEIDRLHNDLTKAKSRLEERENEIRMLEKRCLEKDREKDDILIDKGATINRLASELEAAQNRLVSGETSKLKEKVSQLTSERNAAKEQVKELGSKLEVTAHELVLCRNKLSTNQKEYENWRTTLNQILMESLPDAAYVGEPPSPIKLASLKEVLNRYKQQLQKLPALHEEIAKRDKKLETHRKQESELRARLEEAKGVELQMSSRLAVLQNKLDVLATSPGDDLIDSYRQQNERLQADLEETKAELKTVELKYAELELEYEKLRSEKGSRASLAHEANADLLRELERCSHQLKDTLRENGELKTLYLQVCSSRDTASRELKDLQSKFQMEKDMYTCQEKDYEERIEKAKQLAMKLATELNHSKEEVETANKRIIELQKEFTDKQKEFTDRLNKYLADEKSAMRKEMEACEHCEKHVKQIRCLEEQLNKCNVKLATQESNEALMKELKGKAEFFQQYIMERFRKLREQRSVGTSTEQEPGPAPDAADPEPIARLVQDCDDALAAKTLMMKEKAIRDQIAEKFTLEMKTIEMNCTRKMKEMENENLQVIAKLKELLERKAQEVDMLKEFILSERAKITQVLESKENEISVLIKEHNEIQAECQQAKDSVIEWRLKAERCKEKLSRMSSREDLLKHETEGWKQKREVQSLYVKIGEVQNKLGRLEHEYANLNKEHQTLLEKYKNCKKTVYTYKTLMMKEKAIKDQIAENFTLIIKTVEMTCNRKMKKMKNENLQVIAKLKELLEIKAQEVDMLKEFILSEGSKITQVLESKENEISVLRRENNEIQAECQQAKDSLIKWGLEAERCKKILSLLITKHETERWNQNREVQSLYVKIGEVQNKLGRLQQEHQVLLEKYENCENTVYSYKDYMAKKDAHVNNEMNRIQDEYRRIFLRLQNQIDFQVNCRVQEDRNQGRTTNAQQLHNFDYTETLNQLNEDFAKLAQNPFKEPDPN